MNKQTLISTAGTLGVATAGTPVVSVFGRVHWHFYTQNSHYFAQIQLHCWVAQAELLKLQKSGQFHDEPARIVV